ncbi:MAG: UbiD family decarboxylase [Planctomycetota bacterium]|jgi:4-hydroxy-3-polyprenylbenzoate decarboxylase
MGYRNLRECVTDLEQTGQLIRISQEIDARLEAAEIQRRVYEAGGPAIYFERIKDCRFPMVSNLFGTPERTHFLFRDTLAAVRKLVELKIDPPACARQFWRYLGTPFTALHMLPRRVSSGPVLRNDTTIDQLPQLVSWPRDAGGFVTLPEVYSEDVCRPGVMNSNLGMYRVQLTGNNYEPNREIGLHYQIHRSIGVHHQQAVAAGKPFRVNVFVGGSPAMMLAAVMPLPEGLSELTFAGALQKRRVPMIRQPDGRPHIYAEADFCITGTIDPERLKPEGPFGDHLGYYSLAHDFPVLQVEKVYHRNGAIWPFTVVGRPPQEDTSFGEIIHEITGPVIPTVLPGVKAVHAVDEAGVHPLLLAIGSERYTPFASEQRPQELLTQANAILGQGQLSLAKYLLIAADHDNPQLDIDDSVAFFRHLLSRIDWRRDLHFQTQTTIDTLDYSGHGLNLGSKVVMAATGPARRELATELPPDLSLPEGFSDLRLCERGILAVNGPPFSADDHGRDDACTRLAAHFEHTPDLDDIPLIVLVDDSDFIARQWKNFLWVTFTRSNPAADIYGVGASTDQKHWGCHGPLIIDARIKPHHAPPLVEDPEVTRRVDALAAPGGPLHGII